MSEDWLDIEEKPTAGLPAVVAVPDDFAARVALVEASWARLTLKQKTFLQAWRECRYNASAAARTLGLSSKTKPMTEWMTEQDFATVVRVWRANAAANALDRDRLLARQDDIVETLLTPKPILHQGVPVADTRLGAKPGAVLEEVEAGAAARANETLMQAAGILKSGKDTEVNVSVGIVGPALHISVMPLPPSKAAAEQGVPVELPPIDAEFAEVMPSDTRGTPIDTPVASPAQDDGT